MDRVTIEDVRAAYAATGLRPRPATWCDPDAGTACPLGALVAARWGVRRARTLRRSSAATIEAASLLDLSVPYAMGFVDGFDAKPLDGYLRSRADYHSGHADGRAARAALLGDTACA